MAAGKDIKPGGEVPASVRKSAWWGRVLFLLMVWALLVTVVMIVYGVQARWSDFWDAFFTAVASWVAFARASSAAELPEDAFDL